MKLRARERCPIHHRLDCCGREVKSQDNKPRFRRPVERVDDLHHPRGYRELRTKSAMRELVLKKLAEQKGICPWVDGTDLKANCGARVTRAVKVEILEPGQDRIVARGPRDCRKCFDTNALRSRHYLVKIVAGNELPEELARET